MAENNYIRKLKKVYAFAREYMSANTRHAYHNWNHALDVAHAALRLARAEGVGAEGRFCLIAAALTHDLYVKIGGKSNEEISAKLVETVTPEYGFEPQETRFVARLVRATDLRTTPADLLERIMRDADVDNLGRGDCLEKGSQVQEELGIRPGRRMYELQLSFLKAHEWYTTSARDLREIGKRRNIALLEEKIRKASEDEKNGNATKTAYSGMVAYERV